MTAESSTTMSRDDEMRYDQITAQSRGKPSAYTTYIFHPYSIYNALSYNLLCRVIS